MRILITGGAGFIGSHLILHWLKKYPNDQVLNLDKLSYASNLSFLDSVKNNPQYRFAKVDLADRAAVKNTVQDFQPEGVIHLAAESHVDNSIQDPEPFILSNVVGTFNLIEECKQLWKTGKEKFENPRFQHVSTDEVYGTLGESGVFRESTPYAPNSPYSASKAGSDHIVRAYNHTYGMNTVITNCSNNFGPHQHSEKLIPTVIRSALNGKPIPVYGRGENIRDWLFVKDHCEALDLVFRDGKSGENYNVGTRNEWKNIELIKKICDILTAKRTENPNHAAFRKHLGDYSKLISFVTDRPGHDFRYSIDPSKLESQLEWKSKRDFIPALAETIDWYLEKQA